MVDFATDTEVLKIEFNPNKIVGRRCEKMLGGRAERAVSKARQTTGEFVERELLCSIVSCNKVRARLSICEVRYTNPNYIPNTNDPRVKILKVMFPVEAPAYAKGILPEIFVASCDFERLGAIKKWLYRLERAIDALLFHDNNSNCNMEVTRVILRLADRIDKIKK